MPAALAAAVGLLVAGDTFALFVQLMPNGDVPDQSLYLVRPLAGCYLWLASFGLLLVVALAGRLRVSR